MNGCFGYTNNQQLSMEEVREHQRIINLEEKDRQRFITDVTTLMREFMNHGISQDVSAQLAGMFYNDPEIRKRRNNRRNK